MRYFTVEWWSGCQDGDPQDAVKRYRDHVEAIRNRLPPALLMLQETVSLHDARVLSLNIDAHTRHATLQLVLSTGNVVKLHYGDLESVASSQHPELSLAGPGGYGDLGYDEADVLDDGLLEHRMLFSTSIEITFRFRSIELRQR